LNYDIYELPVFIVSDNYLLLKIKKEIWRKIRKKEGRIGWGFIV